MVRLDSILNSLIIQCRDGCTYLNSSFSLTYITVIYPNGSIGIGRKNLLEDKCEVILVTKENLLSNKFLIAASRYYQNQNRFDTYFFEKVDLDSKLNLDLPEQQVTVISTIIERRFGCCCHEKVQEL